MDRRVGGYRLWRIRRAVCRTLNGAIASASLGTSVSTAAAQTRVGHIDDVRGIVSIATCSPEYAVEPSRQSLSIIRKGVPLLSGKTDSLLLADQLRVRSLTDVRVRVDPGRFGDGNIYLVPEFGRCKQADSALRVRGVTPRPNGEGSYSVSSRRETVAGRQVDRFLLSVDNGVAYIEWGHGPLSVIALGREMRVTGTEFVVVADSATRRAMLYVRDGTVTFAGAGGLLARRDQAFTFTGQGPLTPIQVDETLARDAVYHSRDIWAQSIGRPRAWWARPKVVGAIGGGVVLAGGITYLVTRDHTPASHKGTVIVRLPL